MTLRERDYVIAGGLRLRQFPLAHLKEKGRPGMAC